MSDVRTQTLGAPHADLPYRDPHSVDTRCVQCGEVANLCELLLREVGQLRDEVRALRAAGAARPEPIAGTPAPDSLTPKEAASYLRFPTVRALYAAVHRRQVPVHRLGRRMRFLRAELDAVLARQ